MLILDADSRAGTEVGPLGYGRDMQGDPLSDELIGAEHQPQSGPPFWY